MRDYLRSVRPLASGEAGTVCSRKPDGAAVKLEKDDNAAAPARPKFLNFIHHAEGYVKCTNMGQYMAYNYVYQYKDHLGNIRMNYAKNPQTGLLEIVDENHYYPFGLKHTNYNVDEKDFIKEEEILELKVPPQKVAPYQYKYNGKEWQDELGLNFFDYGAKNYDPAIGRWMNIDPLAETSRRFSPYVYALNNPVFFIDPDGMMAVPPNDDIITKVSNTRGDKHYKQRDVSMTMTLTVVNEKGADLSKTMFNKSAGTVALSSFSGNAQKHYTGNDIMTSDNLSVSVNYKVVGSLKDVGKNDHVMILSGDIPKLAGEKNDAIGRAELGGRVSAVERGTIADGTFNETATHEIGHLLGLEHRSGGLMNPIVNGSTATSQRERGEIIGGEKGPLSAMTGNGTYTQSQRSGDYKTGIKSQVHNFMSNNNISW